ncbi:hypothetical protein QO259_09940 [Salinicola sp. JS01]|uniref:hypothetical protein n=1 Tax=Salinicola sp. JS01 TaxID=3050071 RepID=UPI00255C221B|nr:hypothetical protein [Salinicola sp. JS01]WIX34933.1 hypothetical protein QO259_09940 [Salinicola sp. JS01]
MTEHTIVVRYPEDADPSYPAGMKFQDGSVVAIDFDGNRLALCQELEEATQELLDALHSDPSPPLLCKNEIEQAREVLSKLQTSPYP